MLLYEYAKVCERYTDKGLGNLADFEFDMIT